MDIYNIVLEQIKMDLLKEDIESDCNNISLYDLYNILHQQFEKLYCVTNEKNVFKNKCIFSKTIHKRVSFDIDSKKITIRVYTINSDKTTFYIFKEYNNEEILFSPNDKETQKQIKKFLNKHYYEVINIFKVIEEYKDLLFSIPRIINTNQKEKYYSLILMIDELGKMDIGLDLNNLENLNYYNKQSLFEILDESKFELSKKISIDVNSLNETLQNIVKKYYNEINMQKMLKK